MPKKLLSYIAYQRTYRQLRQQHALTVGQDVTPVVVTNEIDDETQQDNSVQVELGQVIALLNLRRRDDFARRSLRLVTVAPEAPAPSQADLVNGDLDAVDEEELEKRRRFTPYGIAA